MKANCTYISYDKTASFSNIVIDYINNDSKLQPFYTHRPNVEGIKQSIEARKLFPQQREILVQELTAQYEGLDQPVRLKDNIQSLLGPGTFTVTTAHQPSIFTGPLFFIYKILHTIKLASTLKQELPQYNFVPVYYMGSEDADLDEIGTINIDDTKYTWRTKQTGAVGRMKVDKAFTEIIDSLNGQLGVLPYGAEIVQLFKKNYALGKTIQETTLELVNELFGEFGLIVLIADNANFKKLFIPVIEKEIKEQFSHHAVTATVNELGKKYKVQAAGRELNLFYLTNDKRERIEHVDSLFKVPALKIEWTEKEILDELNEHPERFSPNVILRGALQETILPNVAFIGGGGEMAYWFELKAVFESVNIPYPVLFLRNSFLIIEAKWKQKMDELELSGEDLFLSEYELMNHIVANKSKNTYTLNGELNKLEDLYESITQLASTTDKTLQQHVTALKIKAVARLQQLEKKMLRAEKKKFEAEQRQIQKIKTSLFPQNGLQERAENMSRLYAKYGRELIDVLLEHSLALEQQFAVLYID